MASQRPVAMTTEQAQERVKAAQAAALESERQTRLELEKQARALTTASLPAPKTTSESERKQELLKGLKNISPVWHSEFTAPQ